MSSPTSNAATDSRPRRTVYALTDKRGWYLLELNRDFNEYTPHIDSVLQHGMAWLTIEVAQHKRKEILASRKLDLGIARVDLVLGHGGWEPTSTQGVPQ